MHAMTRKVYDETGLSVFLTSPRDVYILVLQRSLRLMVYGQSSIVLAAFFKALAYSDIQLGIFMTCTLLGDAAGSLVLTLYADRLGRAKILLGGSLLMVASGLVFAVSQNYYLLLLSAVVGVITPSGNEIGPFRPIEESILAQLTEPEDRATVFAWYFTLSGLAMALGNLSGGWSSQALQEGLGWTAMASFRFMFLVYAAAGIINSALSLCLSKDVELSRPTSATEEEQELEGLIEQPGPAEEGIEVEKKHAFGFTKETKKKVWLLSGLFGLDNLAGGLVPVTLIVYFFTTKFHVDEKTLGNTFFITSLAAALSNIVAGSLARRIGNIPTMAFTHLPSALLLALIPLPDSFELARAILIAVFCTTKMDIAPRTAFLASYVTTEERTAVMGIINVVKMASQSVGPTITGWLSSRGQISRSFVIAGTLQGTYDLAMLYFFTKAEVVS